LTKYLVLRTSEDSGHWETIKEVEAEGPRSAITEALNGAEENGAPAGTYVATPARSWKPINVKPKRAFEFS
jgi:hypothetical protein